MASLTTALVGPNVQTLAPAAIAGAEAGQVLIINLDLENTVNLGSSQTNLAFPLGPLASAVLTAPVYAAAATQALLVGIAPGGVSYSPGSLTITGPVTAEITGPVTVEGSVAISGTPTVDLAAGTTVDISGTTDVNVQNANIDVIGAGGFITPGQLANINHNGASFTVGANSITTVAGSPYDVSNYSSVVFALGQCSNSSTAAGAAICSVWTLEWEDSTGTITATDTLSCWLGQTAVWEVPVRGSKVNLYVQNFGSTGVITIAAGSCILDGSYRVIPAIRAVNSALSLGGTSAITGCTVAVPPQPVYTINAWLASLSASWSAGAVVVLPLPLWVGQVSGLYQVLTSALAHAGTIVDLSVAVQGGVVAGTAYPYGIVANYSPAVANAEPVAFFAPPSQLAFIYQGTSTPGEVTLSLTGLGL
jgi:hypothetical protein